MTCGAPSLEAPLYEKARLCPQALTYYGFCLQNGNYTVKLHFAETVYAKDEDYSSLGKRVFDIYIQGTRVWKDYNIKQRARGPNKICNETFTAHVKDNLLEIRLFWAGKGSMYNPPSLNGPLISAISVTPDFRVGGLSYAQIAGITVAAIFIPLLLLALMWRIGWVGHKDLRDAQVELRGKSYTVKQVVDATRNFSSKMEIGRGQFGIVYKAELPDQTVAVKKLSPHSKQVIDQIGREVYTLKTVKHQNLVEFLDGYSKKGLHLLIYEYMEHSSLAFALFDPKSNLELDWNTRFNICLGIAKALKYLHEDSRLKIVHRNIKPSNILLDGKLNAKVSDFGLAKLYEEENMNVAIGAGDTLVYMAPEYATVKVVTDKADVYSYGIVLLEIVSGKRNADYEANQEYVYLIDTACLLHAKGKLVDLIDEKLHTYNRDQVLNILNIAMLCIDRSPTLRPTMSEVGMIDIVCDVVESYVPQEQICLLFSKLACHFSTAQVQPRGYPAYGAARSKGNAGSIYGRGYGSYCDEDVGLPCEEMLALRTVINTLELSPAPYITRSFCSGGESLLSITIRCSCIGFVCHFTELDFSHNKLRGSIHEDLGKLSHLIRL
ncbi:hypothetical protein ACOSQ2_016061 [Xanthoceras sorbifolium]